MKLLEALIGIFELPEDDALPDGEHFIEVDETGKHNTNVYTYSVYYIIYKLLTCTYHFY